MHFGLLETNERLLDLAIQNQFEVQHIDYLLNVQALEINRLQKLIYLLKNKDQASAKRAVEGSLRRLIRNNVLYRSSKLKSIPAILRILMRYIVSGLKNRFTSAEKEAKHV